MLLRNWTSYLIYHSLCTLTKACGKVNLHINDEGQLMLGWIGDLLPFMVIISLGEICVMIGSLVLNVKFYICRSGSFF